MVLKVLVAKDIQEDPVTQVAQEVRADPVVPAGLAVREDQVDQAALEVQVAPAEVQVAQEEAQVVPVDLAEGRVDPVGTGDSAVSDGRLQLESCIKIIKLISHH
jgi:hypothetical protein